MNINSSWKKAFYLIWSGQAVSLLTSSIVQFAIIWYLTDTTQSAAVLSFAALAGFLPQALLGPFIGVYIDRWNRKYTMVIADLSIAAVSLILVFVGMGGPIPVWLVMAVLLVRSIGTAFHSPALSAVTPLLVPSESLTKCAGYSQTLQSVSLLVSPAASAVLYASWNLYAIILLDVLGALLAVCTLLPVKIPALPPQEGQRPNVIQEAVEGFHALQAQKGFVGLILTSALFFLAVMPIQALFPLMSTSHFGGTTVDASIAETAFSVGLLAGSLILGAWGGHKNKMTTIILSIILMGVSTAACGFLPPSGFIAFVILTVFTGFSCPFYSGVCMALFQEKIQPEYLGRVMSLSSSIMSLSAPVGLALSGMFGEKVGIANWFIISGTVTLLCAAICFFTPSIRNCTK